MTTEKNKKKSKNISKERLAYVYLPTYKMLNQWKDNAEKSNTSLSKFVIEHVTNSLNHEKENPSMTTRVKLIEDNRRLKEENAELLKQIREQDSHIEMLEKEARSHVIEPFLEPDFTGGRFYSTNLINLFKKEIEIPKEEIYKKLRVNPMDTDATTAIQKHIEILEQYGFLKDVGGKWRWKA